MSPVPGRSFRAVAFLVVAVVAPLSAAAQATSGPGFAPGARTIVDLNFAGTPVGQFPQGLQQLPRAKLEVVNKDGVHMLRASSPSEFVLPLPEALPKNFTLEIELIPKACCNPVDLAVEGVISGSRSAVSAQLEWDPDHFMIVGGNPEPFQMDMPAAIGAALPSTLTTVALSFEDETIRMYTNGQRVYTLSGRKFVRGRVLRVFLGGTDDDQYAVYLARVRVADATSAPVAVTTVLPATTTGTITPIVPNQQATVPASSGAVTAGPVSTLNPTGAASLVLFAPPAQRTISLNDFTAVGVRMEPRTLKFAEYTGLGGFSALSGRTIKIPAFESAGGRIAPTSRMITLAGFSSAGTSPVTSGPDQRAIALTGFEGVGVFNASVPRTVSLTAFAAAGLWSEVASRTITVPAFVAGGSSPIAPRTIKLVGWTAAGSAKTP